MAELVIIAEFGERAEAIVARSLLEAAGFKAFLPEENVLSTMPYLVHAGGGYRLMVRVQDAERAKAALAEARVSGAGT